MKLITAPLLLERYQHGFKHIEDLIQNITQFTPQSADCFLDTQRNEIADQLKDVRERRERLEWEIKGFLAYANSKMEYLEGLEQYLIVQQTRVSSMEEELQDSTQQKSAPTAKVISALPVEPLSNDSTIV